MKHKVDLTQGNIAIQLTKVALPIMFTSFIQMAYNLTDMFWIGRLGSGAVAAVGSAGFFIWLGMSIMLCTRIGMEVTVAQSAGKNDSVGMQRFILNGITISILIILVYSILIFMFAPRLIHFFNLGTDVNGFNPTAKGIQYLRILSCCMLFAFMSPCFSAIYNGLGKSKLPFYFNSAGLGLNIILDPLLIYGVWIFPRLEVAGAAIATIIAQVTVIFLFILSFRKNFIFMHKLKNFLTLQKDYCFRILKLDFRQQCKEFYSLL